METTNQIQTIRSLMPDHYLKKLIKLTKRSPSYISRTVNEENVSSPIWPSVLKLAEEEKKRRAKLIETTQKLKSVA